MLVTALLIACAACSGSDAAGPDGAAPTTARLGIPAQLDDAQRHEVLTTVRARAERLGLRARIRRDGAAITVTPAPDPSVLAALAQRDRTTLVAVDDTGISPGPIESAAVRSTPLDGWGVDVTIDPDTWTTWRDATQPHQGQDLAIVADGKVLGDAVLGVMGQQSRIAGQLRRSDARRIAAALLVDSDLPVALEAPAAPADPGTDTGAAWMSQLAVNVCGTWLDPAPMMTSEVGLHSHQDGLIYVHSLPREQVGRALTLGQFAAKGNWRFGEERLELWDDVDVRNGDECDGRTDTAVRWAVDGVEQSGPPSALALAPGQVIVVSFGPQDAPVPAVPETSELLQTNWGPATR